MAAGPASSTARSPFQQLNQIDVYDKLRSKFRSYPNETTTGFTRHRPNFIDEIYDKVINRKEKLTAD